jgi:HlyD family secretion protein
MKKIIYYIIIIVFFALACNNTEKKSDAYGNFETTEILVSAEIAGKIMQLNLAEGETLEKGQIVGFVDTIQLYLKKIQLESQIKAISIKSTNVSGQIEVLQEQKNVAIKEKERVEKLVAGGAATGKQLDDILGNIRIIDSQINSVKTQNNNISGETDVFEKQILQIEDQISKSYIRSPIAGTVLEKYCEESEIAVAGKSLFKIADLSIMELRAYVSGDQLPRIKIGQSADVFSDLNKTENQQYKAEIVWISPLAEFTPKIIQTKEERVNLVYAIKLKVTNDGSLKIGMPGEVVFH